MAKRGRPKGSKNKATIRAEFDKEQLRLAMRERIAAEIGPMLDAQIAHAKGLKFLMVREGKTGKFVRVSKGGAEKLDPEQEIIEVWEKDPSVQAFTDLMNRTLDKPAETVNADVKADVLYRLTWKNSE